MQMQMHVGEMVGEGTKIIEIAQVLILIPPGLLLRFFHLNIYALLANISDGTL